MKFISLEEQVSFGNKSYKEVYSEIEKISKNSDFSVFYKIRNFNSKDLKCINDKIVGSFGSLVKKKVIKKTYQKTSAFDMTTFVEAGAGGIGEFEQLFHFLKIWLGIPVVFVISNIAIGGFQELGKDIYSWLKSKNKTFWFGRKNNILVVIEKDGIKYYFIIFDYLDANAFDLAWRKMFNFSFDSVVIKKGELGLLSFDTREQSWKLIY